LRLYGIRVLFGKQLFAVHDIARPCLFRDRAENFFEARIDAWIIRDLRGRDCVPCAMAS